MLHAIQLRKESRAYVWPKKETVFKEAKPFKVIADGNENAQGKMV